MELFLQAETLTISLLVVATLVALAVRRLRLPYTVALVLAGLLITFRRPADFELSPALILVIFVPPLVFEAAFHLNLAHLRRNLTTLTLLAVPGVLLTALVVGWIVSLGTGLALPVALVFGALIAATDPVAVVALFRTLGVPKRLELLLEGESLLNDGTAIVLFNLVLAVALTGHFDPVEGVIDFVRVAAGGVLVGLGLGAVVAWFLSRIDDYLIETTLTTALAFGSYLVAERAHVSGVLAVVAAGVFAGNFGPRHMSPTTRIVRFHFWEYVAFLANSLVFLLIGLQIDVPEILIQWQPIVWAIGAVLVARVAVVYLTGALVGRLREGIPLAWQHVLAWGGLRGALSLALALSLPVELGPDRDLLRRLTYGVVLFTLLVEGLTMAGLLRRLGIVTADATRAAYELARARLAALRAAERHLDALHRDGLVSTHAWERLAPAVRQQTAALARDVHTFLHAHPALEATEMEMARREVLSAQRSALQDLRREGIVDELVFDRLASELDTALSQVDLAAPEADELEGVSSPSSAPLPDRD